MALRFLEVQADIAAEEARVEDAMRLALDAKKKNEAAMGAMRETCELLKAMDSSNVVSVAAKGAVASDVALIMLCIDSSQ